MNKTGARNLTEQVSSFAIKAQLKRLKQGRLKNCFLEKINEGKN